MSTYHHNQIPCLRAKPGVSQRINVSGKLRSQERPTNGNPYGE
nr:MAG TPA: hypothetical protein [Caudoviricetes sp.]